jgi:hypothetical protein
VPVSAYGLLMPISFAIAIVILAKVTLGITPTELLHLAEAIRAA